MTDRDLTLPLWAATTILPDGTRVTFEAHRRRAPRWISNGRGRGYMSESYTDYNKKPRIYVSCDETLLENLVNRTTRPVNAWGRVIRKAMKQLELPGRIGWYQRAGCSCPCSPGFIWSDAPNFSAAWYMDKANKWGDRVYDDGYATRRYDVYVKIDGAPVAREDEAAQDEQFDRLGQLVEDPTLPFEALAGTQL